jgi:signal transduction histidine kinase
LKKNDRSEGNWLNVKKEVGVQIALTWMKVFWKVHHRLEVNVMGELLKSALMNLIDNALDFSPKGLKMEVSLAIIEGRIIVRVKDFGPSIQPEFISKLS